MTAAEVRAGVGAAEAARWVGRRLRVVRRRQADLEWRLGVLASRVEWLERPWWRRWGRRRRRGEEEEEAPDQAQMGEEGIDRAQGAVPGAALDDPADRSQDPHGT